MIKSFKIVIFSIVLLLIPLQMLSFAYLFEARNEQGVSCCLNYCGLSFCNPYKPCTRYASLDLAGILEYVSRLSSIEHAKLEPHNTILLHVKQYIQSILSNRRVDVLYQIPQHVSIRFYHDIVEADYLKSKESKPSSQAKSRAIKDNFVTAYLVKLGLMQKGS